MKLAIAMFVLLGVAACAEPKVDVKIYKHIESGNLIYCESGDLDNSDLHEYQGEGKIGESRAVAC